MKFVRWLIIIAVFIAISVAVKAVFPFAQTQLRPSVVPEPIALLGGFVLTNSLLITIVSDLILIGLVFGATRKLRLVPAGLQNLFEIVLEGVRGLVSQTVGGDARRIRWFFPFVMTIFMMVLLPNLLGLLPFFGPLGIVHYDDPAQRDPAGILIVANFGAHTIFDVPPEKHVPPKDVTQPAPEGEFIPLFRAPTSDLNFTLALALISVIATQVFGVIANGPLGYLSKYIVLGKFRIGVAALLSGKIKAAIASLLFGLLDFLIGIIELISELSKIISFTFRLFGNIFAGEVVLLVMAFLFPLLPLPFYGLELMVAVIQAFVFAVLTLAFMTQATSAPHGAQESHH